MRDKRFNRWLLIVLAIAAVYRFAFLSFGDVLPVMWDAGRYTAAAIGVISYVDTDGAKPYATEAEDRQRFAYYTQKYLQGEQINWLSYQPHTLTQARDDLFVSGPLYPLLVSIIIYFSPSNDFVWIRSLGILFDLMSILLVMSIALRLVGRPAAIVAGFICAVYFPFVMTTSMPLLETSTSFWLLLCGYLLIRSVETDKSKYHFLAGLSAGLLILNRSTAMLLAAPILLAYFFYTRNRLGFGKIVLNCTRFAIPLLILFLGWFTLTSFKFGQLTLRDPSYQEANLRQSSNIAFGGYDMDQVEKDFWSYSITEHILSDPKGYAGLLAKKFERLWSRPYNDFQKEFVVPSSGVEVEHQLLMVFGLWGLLLLLVADFGKGAWILLIGGYYTALHIIFHSLARYSFNALPWLFMAAAFVSVPLWNSVKTKSDNNRTLAIAGLSALFFTWLFDYRLLNSLLSLPLSFGLVRTVLILKLVVIAAALSVLGWMVLDEKKKRLFWLPSLGSIIVLAIVFWSSHLSRDTFAEFPCRLDRPAATAGARIYISNLDSTRAGEMLAAVIDVNSGAGRKNTFNVEIDGNKQEFVGGKPPLSNLIYPKPTYRFYAQFIPMGIEEFRQYAIIPLADSVVRTLVEEKGFVDIKLSINERFSEPDNYITVYGNFLNDDSLHYIPGVRFTSVERFVHRGDPRIRYPAKYFSDSVVSYYIDGRSGDRNTSVDLSPNWGEQIGRYNIFLMRFYADGSFKVY